MSTYDFTIDSPISQHECDRLTRTISAPLIEAEESYKQDASRVTESVETHALKRIARLTSRHIKLRRKMSQVAATQGMPTTRASAAIKLAALQEKARTIGVAVAHYKRCFVSDMQEYQAIQVSRQAAIAARTAEMTSKLPRIIATLKKRYSTVINTTAQDTLQEDTPRFQSEALSKILFFGDQHFNADGEYARMSEVAGESATKKTTGLFTHNELLTTSPIRNWRHNK